MAGLSPKQKLLFEAMNNGVVCRYMPYSGRFNPSAYYFRSDNSSKCTAEAKALLKRGLVVATERQLDGRHNLVISDLGKASIVNPAVAMVMQRISERRTQVSKMVKELLDLIRREEWDSARMSCHLGVTLFESLRDETNRLADME